MNRFPVPLVALLLAHSVAIGSLWGVLITHIITGGH